MSAEGASGDAGFETQRPAEEAAQIQEQISDLATLIRASLQCEEISFWRCAEQIAWCGIEVAREQNLCDAANELWFLAEVSRSRGRMVDVFSAIRDGNYADAWLWLEQIEIALQGLLKNPFFEPSDFECETLAAQVGEWQKLYPYNVFASPEIKIKREECSICGEAAGPWSSCTHETGKVYCGEAAYRIVKDMELLSVALVREPVQKYSVLKPRGPNGEDGSDYSMVAAVAQRLRGPFSPWHAQWTTTEHPHSLFADREPSGPCPCESGRTYADCCFDKEGVLRPHLQVMFGEELAAELQGISYHGYGGGDQADEA